MAFYPLYPPPTSTRPYFDYPTGLRRWRAARGLADAIGATVVPVIALGDSITWGVGSDNTITTPNAVAITHCFPARLQSLFGFSPYTSDVNPGEGFIFPNDSRVTVAGGAVANLWACTVFGQGYRLVGATQTLSINIPTGVTSISVIQGNQTAAFNAGGSGLADVTGQYNINAGGNTNIVALTNTGVPISTAIAVSAGQVFQVVGPATAQTYISGFILNTAAANGVQVHRVGLSGSVSASLLGGQSSGALVQTAANQIIAARSCYQWAPTPGVLLIQWSVNDQQFQAGGGSASQNGVTLADYVAYNAQFAQQATADGWDVFFVGGPRDQGFSPGLPTLDQYIAALGGIASANDHMSFSDLGDLWGPYTASQALGVQVSNSEHPNVAGCLDVAAMLYSALMNFTPAGIAALTPG